MQRLLLILLWCIASNLNDANAGSQTGAIASQDTLNRTDENGRKTGWWKVVAPATDKPGYANGALVEEGRYTGGKRAGTWRRYWPNGKVMSEVTYKFGVPRGHYTTYYPNGKVEEEGNWDLDRNTGGFKRFHPNGKPAQEFIFDDYGQRDGVQHYYHENGQMAVEVTIKQGKESGVLKRWFANGDLEETSNYADGVIDVKSQKTFAPKKPVATTTPATEAKAAPAVSAEESTNSMRFRENGFNTLYDKQLRLSQTGEFKDGLLWNGKVYNYGSSGMLVRIEVYIDGRYVGNAQLTDEDLK